MCNSSDRSSACVPLSGRGPDPLSFKHQSQVRDYHDMRQPRLCAPRDWSVAYYHCFSRIVDRRRVLGPDERRLFVALMREYEVFCGVQILTFCVMSNHFHLLVGAFPSLHGKQIRKWLKRWLSEAMNQEFGKPGGGEWWVEAGSTKPVHEPDYYRNAFDYIRLQRTSPCDE